MKKVVVVVLLVVAVSAAAVVAKRSGARTEDLPPATAKVVRRSFSATVSATGAVKPQVGAEVRVGSRISGRVVRLHANIKDVVRKDQVIAELERDELDATVAQRRAEVRLAEARLSYLENVFPRELEKAESEEIRWQATEVLSKKELQRQDDLLKQEFSSQQARDQALEKLHVTQAQLASARKALELLRARNAEEAKQAQAELARARAGLSAAEIQLSYAVLKAPLSGVIGSVSTQEGETVAAGLSAPTFVTIVDLGRLQVDAYVDEVDIGKVQVGQRASFSVDAFPSLDFEGKVVAIYPKPLVLDNVVKYVVALEIATPYDGKLRPEMTASVSVALESRTVLAVPSRALLREHGRTVAYVRTSRGTERRDVRVGWRDGPWAEVASGLKEGDEILLEAPSAEKGGTGG